MPMNRDLICPMAFYVLFMWLSAVYTFVTRFRSIKSGQVSIKYFRALVGEAPPENVVIAARHYDNQFQVPILFFITCLLCIQLSTVNTVTVALAWLFVASRMFHSAILLGKNRVQYRVIAFALGWLVVVAMWGQLLLRTAM
jgi:hypothetical protein